jgi:hypothetical protein
VEDWGGGDLNLQTRQLRAQRPIGTRCAGDWGGLKFLSKNRRAFRLVTSLGKIKFLRAQRRAMGGYGVYS